MYNEQNRLFLNVSDWIGRIECNHTKTINFPSLVYIQVSLLMVMATGSNCYC